MAPIDRRALLVAAASELFAEQAYDEVTTTQIAKRAGVAYGLIAHHITNKRGLYLATIEAAATCLRAVQDLPPAGDTPAEQLRSAIDRHIAFIDDNAAGFLSIMHGGNGADAEVRAIVEGLRWEGATRLLRALGVDEPVHPTVRNAMRGWVALLDEMIMDRLLRGDVPREQLVALAVAALIAVLRTARALESGTGLEGPLLDLLDQD